MLVIEEVKKRPAIYTAYSCSRCILSNFHGHTLAPRDFEEEPTVLSVDQAPTRSFSRLGLLLNLDAIPEGVLEARR